MKLWWHLRLYIVEYLCVPYMYCLLFVVQFFATKWRISFISFDDYYQSYLLLDQSYPITTTNYSSYLSTIENIYHLLYIYLLQALQWLVFGPVQWMARMWMLYLGKWRRIVDVSIWVTTIYFIITIVCYKVLSPPLTS